MTAGKRILIIAGPNGAGKTTFAMEFLPNEGNCPIFVNADLIAAGLNPFRPEHAALRAGRIMLTEIREHARTGNSFAFETTLSGSGYARWIPRWQASGYRVTLLFLRLPTPEQAIARVAQRVSEGGHDVPDTVIRRRFHAGWRNFESVYQDLADDAAVYDNSRNTPALLSEAHRKTCSKHRTPMDERRDADLTGVETAMRRAAKRAQRRAADAHRCGRRVQTMSMTVDKLADVLDSSECHPNEYQEHTGR